ncbi:MAG: hypothetical protein ACE5F8_07510, partial [Woeseiaceae bacterium]
MADQVNVHMRVNQTWHDSAAAGINDDCIVGNPGIVLLPDRSDPAVLEHDHGVMYRQRFISVEQLPANNGDRYIRTQIFLCEQRRRRKDDGNEPDTELHDFCPPLFSAIVTAEHGDRGPIGDIAMRNTALILILAMISLAANSQSGDVAADPQRMEARIEALGTFGTNREGGVSRVAYSDADIAGRDYIKELMRAAGLSVRVDTAGNVIGRREGSEAAPARELHRLRPAGAGRR